MALVKLQELLKKNVFLNDDTNFSIVFLHVTCAYQSSISSKVRTVPNLSLKQTCVAIEVDILLVISHRNWCDTAFILCCSAVST